MRMLYRSNVKSGDKNQLSSIFVLIRKCISTIYAAFGKGEQTVERLVHVSFPILSFCLYTHGT